MVDEDDPRSLHRDDASEAPVDPPPRVRAAEASERRGRAPTNGAGPPPVRRDRVVAKLLRLAATGVILAASIAAGVVVWQSYVVAPWTRDGRVRVQVANIAPQVAGQIVEVRVADNQAVRRGDVLYVIDPFDFRVGVASAEAEVDNRQADLQVKNAQSARRQALSTVSTSVEEKQQFAGTAKIAEAALEAAKSRLAQAKVNLERTEVKSTVNGRVTNLLMRVGDYAQTGTPNIRVVDTDSFWVDGYFEETKMPSIHVGDRAEMALMGYDPPLRGTVESITAGISTANATPSTQGLPDVNPVYTWVRLAQRVPVRIRIDHLPPGVPLVAGMTATVVVNGGAAPMPGWFMDLRHTVTGAPVPAGRAGGR